MPLLHNRLLCTFNEFKILPDASDELANRGMEFCLGVDLSEPWVGDGGGVAATR